MSNQFAIAAVTRTIQGILQDAGIRQVTTVTPDQAARDSGRRINLFLYHTMHNAAWRNQDIPGRVRKSDRGNPPLAVNLHYLLTAYGEDGTNLADQELLGMAMRTLHDRPVLKAAYIEQALQGYPELAASELANQIDKVRIVPEFLDIENMSRLWTTFQTQYRVSAAYQASVVLIESLRPSPSALPVTRRGDADQGVLTDLGLEPTIYSLEYRGSSDEPKMPSAKIGSTVTLLGANLPSTDTVVSIHDPKTETIEAEAEVIATLTPRPGGTDQSISVLLDENAAAWRSGLMALELRLESGERRRFSNSIALAIAPELVTGEGDASVIASITSSQGKRLMTVSLAVPIGPARKVFLTLNPFSDKRSTAGFIQIPAQNTGLDGSMSPVFEITKVPPGEYWVRISVDGIDSQLMRKRLDPQTGKYQLEFDPRQRVRIP